jgi:hypothetical protein
MEKREETRAKTLTVLILAVVGILLYSLAVWLAYPEFQSTRLDDPLAELHSLSPLYYVAIALAALSIVCCLVWRVGSTAVHLALLLVFAGMLWLTPYFLTGFVRLGDAPWHVGVGMRVTEVLDGASIPFTWYASHYPVSYVWHNVFVTTLGIEPSTYITLYPVACTTLFVLLCYCLVSRLFDGRVALLALLLAIPGLHYLQLHASPHTMGTVLMLAALLLLTMRVSSARVVPLVALLVGCMIAAHPTSPLLFAIFVGAALLAGVIYSRRIARSHVMLLALLLLCMGGWYLWYTFHPAGIEGGGVAQMAAPGGLDVAAGFLTGTRFVYANIYSLNKGIYYLYALLAVAGVLYAVAGSYLKDKDVKLWLRTVGGLRRSETLLAISVLPLVLLTFLLAENAHELIESGLTYIILAASCVMASIAVRVQWPAPRLATVPALAVVVLLTLTHPVVAYSIDAYSSAPRSEKDGLEFLTSAVPMAGRSMVMFKDDQLSLLAGSGIDHTEFLHTTDPYRPQFEALRPDIFVYRNTGYYYAAMRIDLSFEDNRFTTYRAAADRLEYDRVYSSPTFEVYLGDEAGE